MGFEPTFPKEQVGPVVQTARAVLVVTGAVAAGLLTWIVLFLVGVSTDIVGLMFYREEDYPYASAWGLGSTAIAAVVTGLILWRALPRRDDVSR